MLIFSLKSGAGKTTLLNVLNFRNRGKLIIEGDVKINGQLADWDTITRYSGYVQQDDLFYGTLTVREHLTFLVNMNLFIFILVLLMKLHENRKIKAMMKMNRSYSSEEKYARIEEVIKQVSFFNILVTIFSS